MSLTDFLTQQKPEENTKTISIQCEGTISVALDDLHELQSYKELDDKRYDKAKQSILTLGFSFPIFVWENDNKYWIIDAHQRKRVLTRMRDVEGYTIPLLPAIRVRAEDKREAKKKILAQESQYGKIQEEPFYEFINEEGFEIDTLEANSFVEIPEFDFEFNQTDNTEDLNETKKDNTEVECPECHAKFIPR